MPRFMVQLFAILYVLSPYELVGAECLGGVGVNDIVISNIPSGFYTSGDIIDCEAVGSITLGPLVTIPSGVGIKLVAPEISMITEVGFSEDSLARISNRAGPLNDTGVVLCSDPSDHNLLCPIPTYPGQDAEFGRDVSRNDYSNGHAGFSFTKLDQNGNFLLASASMWSCVRDNVTGLIWEVKTDDTGLHDRDHTYSWYSPDASTNGGHPGTINGGTCNWSNCDTYGFVQAVNAEKLCGYDDWRMPTIKDLENIVKRDVQGDNYSSAMTDSNYFPRTSYSAPYEYWSGTSFAQPDRDVKWYVHFSNGRSYYRVPQNPLFVRLVRGQY